MNPSLQLQTLLHTLLPIHSRQIVYLFPAESLTADDLLWSSSLCTLPVRRLCRTVAFVLLRISSPFPPCMGLSSAVFASLVVFFWVMAISMFFPRGTLTPFGIPSVPRILPTRPLPCSMGCFWEAVVLRVTDWIWGRLRLISRRCIANSVTLRSQVSTSPFRLAPFQQVRTFYTKLTRLGDSVGQQRVSLKRHLILHWLFFAF